MCSHGCYLFCFKLERVCKQIYSTSFFVRRTIFLLSKWSLCPYLILVYGLQRFAHRGYKQHVRTECWLHIQAIKRSRPRPYPPCGDVPYLSQLDITLLIRTTLDLLALVGIPEVTCGRNLLACICSHQLVIVVHSHGTSHNLTDTGHQHINTFRDATI